MILFDGDDIRVVARLVNRSEDLVITFTGRAADPPVEKGFGEAYLLKRKISALHFISKANHWWQTPETHRAIAELNGAGLIDRYRRVILYGSSMGGYAALLLSRVLPASRIVVFSPQYSIDERRVPFEQRWRNYASQLRFDYDDMAAGLNASVPVLAAFDPFFRPDAQHVELIETLRPVDRIPIAFAGHNTARMLQELGILASMTDTLLLGEFDTSKFVRTCRRLRRHSSLFWYGLAESLAVHGRGASSNIAAMLAAFIASRSEQIRDRTLQLDILHLALLTAYRGADAALVGQWLAAIEKIEPDGHRTDFARAIAAEDAGDLLRTAALARAALKESRIGPYAALLVDAVLAADGVSSALITHDRLSPLLQQAFDVRIIRARVAIAQGDWSNADAILSNLIKQSPRDPRVSTLYAEVLINSGSQKQAIAQLRMLLGHPCGRPSVTRHAIDLLRRMDAAELADVLQQQEAAARQLYRTVRTRALKLTWSDVPNAIASLNSEVRAKMRVFLEERRL